MGKILRSSFINHQVKHCMNVHSGKRSNVFETQEPDPAQIQSLMPKLRLSLVQFYQSCSNFAKIQPNLPKSNQPCPKTFC